MVRLNQRLNLLSPIIDKRYGLRYCIHERTVRKTTGGPNEKLKTRVFLNFNETLVNAKNINNIKLLSKDY